MTSVVASQHAPSPTFSTVADGLPKVEDVPERNAAVPKVKKQWALHSSRDFYAESWDTAFRLYSSIRF